MSGNPTRFLENKVIVLGPGPGNIKLQDFPTDLSDLPKIIVENFFPQNLIKKHKEIFSDFRQYFPLLFVSGNRTNLSGK